MPEESTAVAAPPSQGGLQEVNVSALAASKGSEPASNQEPLNDAFSELDRMMGEPSKEETKPAPKSKSAETAEKKSQPPAKDAKTAEMAKDQSAKDAKESDGLTTENGKALPAPELRKAYQELKAKHAALEKEYTTFKSTPREDPERKTLAEKLAAAEKHRQQLDEELRHTAYERSEEFKQRYHAPFVDAWKLGQETAAQYWVIDAEGNKRQGKPEDFDVLMQIPDEETAAKWAEDVYGGAKAARMLQHRMDVIKHGRMREAVLQESKKNLVEREKMRSEADMAQRKAMAERWEKLNKDAAEKYPQWFKEVEGDDKGNELLRKGYEFADKAFSGAQMTPEEQVEHHSILRNRAAAFGREVYKNKQLTKRVTELEAKLKEYEDSEPKAAEGKSGGKAEVGELDWEKRMEAQWV